jgi:DNA-binding transcriptional MerR regulator
MSEMLSQFTAQQVVRFLGIPYKTLDTWDQTSFICPSVRDSTGTGRSGRRLYSFSDMVALRVARELREAGVSLQSLREVINKLRTEHGFSDPMTEGRLVTDGQDVFLLDDMGIMSILKKPGQRCLYVIDLAGAVQELQQTIEKQMAA